VADIVVVEEVERISSVEEVVKSPLPLPLPVDEVGGFLGRGL